MRWIYFNDNPQEAAEREAIVAKIDAWWRAFEGKVDDLRAHFKGKARWDLPQWMDDNLHPIHPKIMWEYGPAVRVDGHRLVLTPESAHELRPLVAKILERTRRSRAGSSTTRGFPKTSNRRRRPSRAARHTTSTTSWSESRSATSG